MLQPGQHCDELLSGLRPPVLVTHGRPELLLLLSRELDGQHPLAGPLVHLLRVGRLEAEVAAGVAQTGWAGPRESLATLKTIL